MAVSAEAHFSLSLGGGSHLHLHMSGPPSANRRPLLFPPLRLFVQIVGMLGILFMRMPL